MSGPESTAISRSVIALTAKGSYCLSEASSALACSRESCDARAIQRTHLVI